MRKKITIFPSGFTLFEVIITLAIMIVVFSLAISEIKTTNSRSNLTLTTENLVSDLRTTVMSALNSETLQLKTPTSWGVYFSTGSTASTYTIFADLNSDGSYNSNEKFKTITLASNLSIPCVSVGISSCVSPATVLFNVPNAKPTLAGGSTDPGNIIVQLEDLASPAQPSDPTNRAIKEISINPLGVISFK